MKWGGGGIIIAGIGSPTIHYTLGIQEVLTDAFGGVGWLVGVIGLLKVVCFSPNH